MSQERFELTWRGIRVEITYTPDYAPAFRKGYGHPLDHLEIRSLAPERAPLPITETGYLSYFTAREMGIEAYGLDLHSGFNILKQRILDVVGQPSDLVLSHPPYHNLIVYSGAVWGHEPHPDDLSRCATEEEFMDKLIVAMKNQRHATRPGGYYGTPIGDIRKDGQYFSLQAELITRCPKRELRAILIKQQFNPASDRKAYPLPLPRIMHEYVILWQKPHPVTVPAPAPPHPATPRRTGGAPPSPAL